MPVLGTLEAFVGFFPGVRVVCFAPELAGRGPVFAALPAFLSPQARVEVIVQLQALGMSYQREHKSHGFRRPGGFG